MRFFSKLAAVCNIFFIMYVVFWFIDQQGKRNENNAAVIQLPWIVSTIVITGYLAIVVNLLFLIIYFIYSSFKIPLEIPKWLIIFNVIIFCCQVYFHFFFK